MRPRRVDPARRAAFELQHEVAQEGAYANLVWPGILDRWGLSGRDAAFATELGYGALRWRGRHDAVLSHCLDRPLADLDPALLAVLRLGVHQWHNMRVGAHAAVSESVNLTAEVVNSGAARLANAVLRRVCAGGSATDWLDRLVAAGAVSGPDSDPAGYLAVAQSHPKWIVTELAASLPAGSAVADLLVADNKPAGVTLAARSLSREELLARLGEQGVAGEPGHLSRLAVNLGAANPRAIPEVATGLAGVQDEGSQVVALALADAELAGRDERWLDLCAGPGGKAALLAAQVAQRGGTLTAVELHDHRARLVRNAMRPVQGRHEVIAGDALTLDLPGGYDRVLVDAPCSGLGALRRRPESRWRRTAAEVPGLVRLQRQLLERALELVRPGGLVMYATCTPTRAETVDVVTSRRSGQVRAIDGPMGTSDGPYLRTWPHLHGTDGMFAALIQAD